MGNGVVYFEVRLNCWWMAMMNGKTISGNWMVLKGIV
jgi:hypothetical protein